MRGPEEDEDEVVDDIDTWEEGEDEIDPDEYPEENIPDLD